MKKALLLIFVSLFVFGFAVPAAANAPFTMPTVLQALPENYPPDIRSLVVGSEITVLASAESDTVDVFYVSDVGIDTLRDEYIDTLHDADFLTSEETSSGYWIFASRNGLEYTIMLDEEAMDSILQYAGKVSVYIVLRGLGFVDDTPPSEEYHAWPAPDLPGVPEFKGDIFRILRDSGVIYLDMYVKDASVVYSYIAELTEAGFSLDGEPSVGDNYLQFMSFKNGSILNFAYDPEEGTALLEYLK